MDYSKSKAFWRQLKDFVKNVQVNDALGEADKCVILEVCDLKLSNKVLMTTDQLVAKVVKMGLPLPVYDYEYNKYVTVIPQNVRLEDSIIGVENADAHDSFISACLRIVEWGKYQNPNQDL